MEALLCPRCRTPVQPVNAVAAERMRRGGRCQGCRAGDTLRRRPWLLPLFVGFWKTAGFPASEEWLRRLPASEETAPRSRTVAGETTRGATA